MRSAVSYLRTIIALALITGLGFAGVCPCQRADSPAAGNRVARHDDHSCACLARAHKCCCESECQCGSSLPKQSNQLAVPGGIKDPKPSIASLPTPGVYEVFAAASPLADSPAHLAIVASNLLAQGTRLNI